MSLTTSMDNVARAILRAAKRKGDSGTYYNRNDSGYTCYFFWASANVETDASFGVTNDMETSAITLPRIAGSTGLEPSPGDLIAINSIYWSVVSVQKLGLPSNPCGWKLDIRREAEANTIT